MRPSLEGLIHTPQLSNCTKLQGENDYTLIFCLLLLLHTKVPLATSSNMDTPPRDSNDLSSVIMCQCYIQLQQPPVLNPINVEDVGIKTYCFMHSGMPTYSMGTSSASSARVKTYLIFWLNFELWKNKCRVQLQL